MSATEEPVLSRFDRLDIMMGYLEELRSGNKSASARSSSPTSPSSGTPTTATSDGGGSPRRVEKRCRPMDAVMMEIRLKGNLIDRLLNLEDRVLKMSMLLEEEIEMERRKEDEAKEGKKTPHKKGLKGLVKSCVKGPKHKHKAGD